MRFSITAAMAAVALVAVTGCGSSNSVWVTCEIAKGGKPYTVPDGQVLQVTFYAIEAKDASGKGVMLNEPFAAAATSEGRYELSGPDGQGIPPGKYRVSVIQTPKNTATAPRKSKRVAPDRDYDYLEDRFGPDKSPIVLTIDKSEHFLIDLDRPSQ